MHKQTHIFVKLKDIQSALNEYLVKKEIIDKNEVVVYDGESIWSCEELPFLICRAG